MANRVEPGVWWGEGMFLQPHHFQALQRHVESSIAHMVDLQPYGYGVRKITLEDEAIENFRFAIERCDITMPDGTIISIPDTAEVKPREFRELFEATTEPLEVFLGVVSSTARSGVPAFAQYPVELNDENTANNPTDVTLRKRQIYLFFSGEDTSGFRLFKLAEIGRDPTAELRPVLLENYVPPLLCIGGDPRIQKMLREAYHAVVSRNRALGDQIRGRRVSLSGENMADAELLLRLLVTNSQLPVLRQISETRELHPFAVYLELCRVLGDLAIFDPDRVVPELPLYNQNQLFDCFEEVTSHVQRLMGSLVPVQFETVAFQPGSVPGRLECSLKPEWAEGQGVVYVGIESDRDSQAVQTVMAQLKLAAPEDIEDVRLKRIQGIPATYSERIPAELPDKPGVYYFQVQPRDPYWSRAFSASQLSLDGPGVSDPALRFSLYVVMGAGGI